MNKSESKKDIYDYLIQIANYRTIIVLTFIFFLILTYIITLFLPIWYRAEVEILPPQGKLPINLSALTSNIPVSPSIFGVGEEETMKYIVILESRTLLEKIIRSENLVGVYNVNRKENALKILKDNTNIQIENEGTILVQVMDKSPNRAAKIANKFVYYLDSLYTKFSTQKAHFNRIFFENQLNETLENLQKAETDLQKFQSEYGAIALPEQIEATIKTTGEMIANKFTLQIELMLKKKMLSPSHPDIVELEQKIQAIDQKIKSIETGDKAIESVLLPFENLPELSYQYAKLLREVEIQNKIYIILYQQYQQAKIEEAKNTPSIQVLDEAVPPIKRAKPRRILIASTTAISTTLFLLIILFISIHFRFLKYQDPEKFSKIKLFYSKIFSQRKK